MKSLCNKLLPLGAALAVLLPITSSAAIVNVAKFGNVTTDQFTFGNNSPNLLINGETAGSRGIVHGDEFLFPGFHYLLDIGTTYPLTEILLYPRVGCCPERFSNVRVSVLQDLGGFPGNEV